VSLVQWPSHLLGDDWGTVGDTRGLLARWPWQRRKRRCRRYFDPASFRAALFDQRRCGRSHPLAGDQEADLSTNTMAHPRQCTSPGVCLSRSRGWCRVGYSQRPTIKTNRMISDAVDMRQAADVGPTTSTTRPQSEPRGATESSIWGLQGRPNAAHDARA
jgi:hypothetical protein